MPWVEKETRSLAISYVDGFYSPGASSQQEQIELLLVVCGRWSLDYPEHTNQPPLEGGSATDSKALHSHKPQREKHTVLLPCFCGTNPNLDWCPPQKVTKRTPQSKLSNALKKYKSYFLLLTAIYLWQHLLKILLLSLGRDYSLHIIIWKNKLYQTQLTFPTTAPGALVFASPSIITSVNVLRFPVGEYLSLYCPVPQGTGKESGKAPAPFWRERIRK